MADMTLVFDLGNVLFPLDYDELYEWLKTTHVLSEKEFRQRFDQFYVDFEAGVFEAKDFLKMLKSQLQMKFQDEIFIQKWVSIWKKSNEDCFELLRELKEHRPLYLLSNTNALHMDVYFKTQPILKIFDRCFLSYELRMAKPHVEIYERVQRELNVSPSQVIFFDDKVENVAGARQAGWNAFVYIDAANARKDLADMGVI